MADQTVNTDDLFRVSLRVKRQQLGLSQEEVAHRADLSQSTVSKAERLGRRAISDATLARTARALGVHDELGGL